VWSVLRQARHGRDGLASAAPESAPFWGPRARQATGAPVHPWLADLPALTPAKRVQVQALMGMQAAWHRSRRGAAARIIHPLLSQPIVELALSIPVWRLLGGGRDRALARSAFTPWLPAMVAERQSKGALTSDYTKRVAASLPFLREHLVGGVLAEAGVLDAAAVDAALDPDQLIWNGAGARLSQAALIESWVRHWQTRVPDHPAARR
jgi:asparagine synthase (glutamine-hydrolysing)